MAREEIAFRSGDADCAGWLYRPDSSAGPVACVVLAHGFAGVKEALLDEYAKRFAAAGHAALVFDYRHFGDSGGEPRLLLDIGRQHDDWRAAIAHARSLEGVDPSRIALWGTSFSGGHVVALAARDPGVAAVIAQAPYTDGPATLRALGAADCLRLTAAALRDWARSLCGSEPHLIPVVAPPGSLAAMNSPGSDAGYKALFPQDYAWPNRFAPRVALRLPLYSPLRVASRVRMPLLVQVMSDDLVTPPAPARRVAERAPLGELVEYPGGHFEIYVGEPFERAVDDQLDFLDRRL